MQLAEAFSQDEGSGWDSDKAEGSIPVQDRSTLPVQ